jgi:hypothetical protein
VKIVPPVRIPLSARMWSNTSKSASYTIDELHPGCSIILCVQTNGKESPPLRFSSPNTPINLQEQSLKTIMVKYEFEILLTLIGLWILLSSTYLSSSRTSRVTLKTRNVR